MLGRSVSGAGDVNNDGVLDIVASQIGWSKSERGFEGQVNVYSGKKAPSWRTGIPNQGF